jgi:hypothetical protein
MDSCRVGVAERTWGDRELERVTTTVFLIASNTPDRQKGSLTGMKVELSILLDTL